MNNLRIAHQFFQFSQRSALQLWGPGGPSEPELELQFRSPSLPLRALKRGQPRSLREARREMERIEAEESRAGVRVIPFPDFPAALTQNIPPERLPPLLYLRGGPIPSEASCLAVVGTRHPSPGGAEAAANFSAFFTTQGLRVLSGLAKGIDTIAHREGLRLGTVALLGSGVWDVYPAENAGLAENIVEKGGTLLSPFPLGQVPLPANFPQRNELIADLAAGIVVIEGRETSGAAVTGRLGLAMGKGVVTLTQDYRSAFGQGAIALQQAGAVLVRSEPEALQAVFARLGGFAGPPLLATVPTKGRAFSFRDFLRAAKCDVPSALALLEEGIAAGRIERESADRYRIRKITAPNAKQ